MTLPTTTAEYRALGHALPHPVRRERAQRAEMKRSLIGAGKRARDMAEAREAATFEALLNLHRLDYWHCTVSQRSQAGWPDYVVFGVNWLAFVELKARSLNTKRAGKVSDAQRRYQWSIEAAGGVWLTFLLPDQWNEVEDWLNGHTGKGIRGTWRTRDA